jgi:DNA-binding SARP family transcriptional activator/tetratricopeptide (TPR) repeat protein
VASDPHVVSIGLLGRFEVAVDGRVVPADAWGRRHAAALVKLLALTPQHVLHREQVIDVLWPDTLIAEAGPRLHKAAHFARRACGVDSAIELRNDLVTLFAGADVVVDAVAFEAAAAAALAARDVVAAAAAADQYMGDLLPEDLYQPWADDTRDRLRLLHIGVLRLGQRWEVLAAADPTDEDAHVALARQHLERGDARSALRQLERGEQMLREHLDVGLGSDAAALLDEVRRSLLARTGTRGAGPSHRDGHPRVDEPIQSVLSSARATHMTGRDRELSEIARVWRRAVQGHASFVFLGGEPGIGKTTLAAHAAYGCRAEGGRVLFGRSDPEIDIPYQPFTEAFDHWSARGDAVEARTSAGTAALLRLLAPMKGGGTVHTADAGSSRDVFRNDLFDAIREWLELLAAERATVLVLDDLHWADDASLSVLRNVIRHPPTGALLVLGTYRPEELGRNHALRHLLADARGDPAVFRVDLAGITAVDVQAMVEETSAAPLPPEGVAFAAALHDRTNGNPLFTRMTLHHLIENRVIEPDAGRWSIDESFAGLSVAAGVTEVVERRLALLDDDFAAGVRTAAVLGDMFHLRTLATVLEVDDEYAIGLLAHAARVGLVREVPEEIDCYRFTHALIRDALEASVPRSSRLRVHWNAGRALEATSGDDDRQLDEIVHHLTVGAPVGDSRHAAVACIRAGSSSLRRLAFETARIHFTQALSLIDPDAEPDLAWQALNGRGEAAGALLDQNEGPSLDHLHAAAIARAQDWPERLVRSALGFAYFQLPGSADRSAQQLLDDALHRLPEDAERLRCEALAAYAIQCVTASDAPAARSSADHALLIARRLDDPTLIATALSARCYVLLGSPAVEELRRSAIEAVSRPLPPEGRFMPPHFALGVVAMQRGRRTDLDRAIDEVRRAAENRHSRSLAVFLPSWDAAIALAAGAFIEAHRHAVVARDLSSAPAWRHAFAAHVVARRIELGRDAEVMDALAAYVAQVPHARAQRCILANMLVRRGAHHLAREHLSELRERSWSIDGWDSAICLRHLGEVAVAMPDAEMVDALSLQVAPYTGQLLTSFTGVTIEAAADRVRGQLLLAAGRAEEAVDAFDAARAIEEAFKADVLAVRSAYWQARARLAAGGRSRCTAARAIAADAAARAGALGMDGLVRDFGALAFP